ncbi:MAG TPA: PDDEXK nuclease domain-containing protein [Limnobacter sp.]|uniref:PDDEXK nuclease domain-containing protein n=1 Tax=Limnobacter sp. TaxID=2003368 RepID=UPI002ED9B1A1
MSQLHAKQAGDLHAELRALIASSRHRLSAEVLGGERASYGAQLLDQLGQQLSQEFGRGFEARNLRRMVRFAQAFPDAEIVSTLSTKLSCSHLVAIELKLGRFKAAHKGQMGLYLKWLDKHERQPGEEAPIGLILCTESSREQAELLQMHKDDITVAEYWAELPPKAQLEGGQSDE